MFRSKNEKGTRLGQKIDQATAPHLTSPDANITPELAALAGSDKKSSYWIVKHLRHKLWDKDISTVLNAVHIFETLMSSNSPNIFFEMNRKGIQEFEKLYWIKIKPSKRGHLDGHTRGLLRLVLQCVEDWYNQLRSQRLYSEFSRVYHSMMSRGVKFPSQVANSSALRAITGLSVQMPSSQSQWRQPNLQTGPEPSSPSSTGIRYRIHRPTFFYSQPNLSAVMTDVQGPFSGVLDAVFEENGWILLETGMYIPVRDPQTGALIAEGLPYSPPPKPPSPKNDVEKEDNIPVEDQNKIKYGPEWVQSDFVIQMKRIISLIDLCQEMLMEPSLTAQSMVTNESLQLMIHDLTETQQQVAEMMDTLTEAKCLEFIFKVKNHMEQTLQLQEFVYKNTNRPENVRINKQSLSDELELIQTELQQSRKVEVSSISDEIGEVSHDEDDDPFGLDSVIATSIVKPKDDFKTDAENSMDPFLNDFAPPAATEDPFAQVKAEDPFAVKSVDPFAQPPKESDPFSQASTQLDPFQTIGATTQGDPFATGNQDSDPFNQPAPQKQEDQPQDPFSFLSQPAVAVEPGSPNHAPLQSVQPVDIFNFTQPAQPGNSDLSSIKVEQPSNPTSQTDFFATTGPSEKPNYEDPFAHVVGETPFQEPAQLEIKMPKIVGSSPIMQPFQNQSEDPFSSIQPKPGENPFQASPNPPSPNPFQLTQNPAPSPNPFAANPFALGNAAPVDSNANPFSQAFPTTTPEQATEEKKRDPFASLGDPFAGFKTSKKKSEMSDGSHETLI